MSRDDLLDGACPDGGTCHHECVDRKCFRVKCCEPLSDVFPNNEWPDLIVSTMFPTEFAAAAASKKLSLDGVLLEFGGYEGARSEQILKMAEEIVQLREKLGWDE